MRVSKLKELSGKARLSLDFFNNLIGRIECTKPVAGLGVVLVDGNDGTSINIDPNGLSDILSGGSDGFTTHTLKVCNGNSVVSIQVYGPSTTVTTA